MKYEIAQENTNTDLSLMGFRSAMAVMGCWLTPLQHHHSTLEHKTSRLAPFLTME